MSLNFFKRSIKSFDYFNSSQMLKFQNESDYRTLTGGITSIILIGVILFAFSSMIIDTFNRSNINYSIINISNMDPLPIDLSTDRNFMMAVKIDYFNRTIHNTRQFSIFAYVMQQNKKTPIELQLCQEKHWQGTNIWKTYTDKSKSTYSPQNDPSNWFCLSRNNQFQIKGTKEIKHKQFLSIKILPCYQYKNILFTYKEYRQVRQRWGENCTLEEYFEYIQRMHSIYAYFYKQTGDPFEQTLYLSKAFEKFTCDSKGFSFSQLMISNVQLKYIDYIVNPSNMNSIQGILKSSPSFIAGPSDSHRVISSTIFGDTINTDQSILPFQTTTSYNIFHFNQNFIKEQKIYRKDFNKFSLQFRFQRDTKSYVYDRKVQKVSQVISYIGGLIGALVALLYFLNSYSVFSLQIAISRSLFKNKAENQDQIEQQKTQKKQEDKNIISHTNGFQCIKFMIYNFFKQNVKIKFNWPKYEYMSQFLQQISHQLDIKNLIQRVIFLEHCTMHLFEDYQIQFLQKDRPLEPKKVKQLRQKFTSIIDKQIQQEKKKLLTQRQINKTLNNLQGGIKYYNSNGKMQINDLNKMRQGQENKSKDKNFIVVDHIINDTIQEPFQNNQINIKAIKKTIKTKNFLKLIQSSQKGNQISKRLVDKLKSKKARFDQNINTNSQQQSNVKLQIIPIQFIQENIQNNPKE